MKIFKFLKEDDLSWIDKFIEKDEVKKFVEDNGISQNQFTNYIRLIFSRFSRYSYEIQRIEDYIKNNSDGYNQLRKYIQIVKDPIEDNMPLIGVYRSNDDLNKVRNFLVRNNVSITLLDFYFCQKTFADPDDDIFGGSGGFGDSGGGGTKGGIDPPRTIG